MYFLTSAFNTYYKGNIVRMVLEKCVKERKMYESIFEL